MKYAYEDLSPEQFETLVVFLCQRLLGISVQGFAKGPDGGRDAKFVGAAELHPSKAAPWEGITIIQAKHTNGYNRNFTESDFYSTASTKTVLGKEVPRIKKLRSDRQIDHYMLFSNRRLAGNAESEIRACIAKQCEIPEGSIYLCGLEQLETWLKTFPDVPKLAELDPVDSPLIVSPDDLAQVVHALARQEGVVLAVLDDPPTPRVTYEQKNGKLGSKGKRSALIGGCIAPKGGPPANPGGGLRDRGGPSRDRLVSSLSTARSISSRATKTQSPSNSASNRSTSASVL